jgi:hypothetical protein
MRKIGLLCLTLVLALGALGVGYAHWTDTITIEGTVNTGSVDINVEYYSGTDVYKDLGTEGVVTVYWLRDACGALVWSSGQAPANGLLVASAKAEPGPTDDTVVISYNNTFPCETLVADFIVHYTGSVPAMVDAEFTSADEWLEDLWDSGAAGAYGALVDIDPAKGFEFIEAIEELPIQMHYCNYAKVWLWLHLPQDDTLMNKTGNFTATITATQWNLYEQP